MAVINDLVNIEATGWLRFTKLDIKDFYLNGKPEVLANAAGSLFEGKMKGLVVDVKWYLLDNQYVASPHVREAIFKITRGSGIGVRHSGELADTALYSLVERRLLKQDVLQEFGILKWWRFRDDVLLLHKVGLDTASLLQKIEGFDSTWRFELEADCSNMYNLHYLDIRVGMQFSARSYEFVSHPEYKSTALKRRLSCESMHHSKVHQTWPRMMMEKVAGRCFNSDVGAHRAILAQRLVQGGLSEKFVSSLLDDRMPRVGRRVCETRRLWIPLPYHPAWSRSLSD